MGYDRWDVALPDGDAAAALERAGYRPLAARTLVRRGILSPEEAGTFFRMTPGQLHDPFLLPDMRPAVERLRLAAERGETVAVYGDYDADGVTATALMLKTLRGMGLDCIWHIPDREREGYGLNGEAVEELCRQGASLIVTVDTGVTAHKEIGAAKRLGADVIVTDHHECRDTLPDALAVVNPRRAGSAYPFAGLAGVGVAFKLACALAGGWRDPLIRYADLVALGTVADVMPVTGENRLLITQGLRAMAVTGNPGLRALLRETGQDAGPVTADTAAFILGPRVNAAGRVGRAGAALKLLLAEDPAEAEELARALCELNTLRQSRENEVLAQAAAMAESAAPALVLAREGWPAGIAGIVAARLAEQYERPVFIGCIDGDTVRGSARGTGDICLTEMLSGLSPLLEGYGGHGQAAGFSLRRDNFETFRQAVEKACAPLRRAEAVLEVDAEVRPEWLGADDLRGLEELAPFGAGFPRPVFALRGVTAVSAAPMGGGKHWKLVFDCGGGKLDAVWFNGSGSLPPGRFDIAFRTEVNRFRGQEQPRLRLADVREGGV
ncbi:MAG: single-stranded-DNA-specific exonuclease RecJ [Oscillospiraceae bacterium]|nr:single-stranded-DNA-specific exonuclease RecJ [Oscillospiraceae bacterium]